MNQVIIFLACLALTCVANSQGIKPQNVYRVVVTSQYVLKDGERTSEFFSINQEISDSLGRMHTDIDFNPETGYPDNYRWHYFDNNLKVRTDFFINEKINRRIVYQYNTQGMVSAERHFEFDNEKPGLVRTVEFSYNTMGLPVRSDAYNPAGKRLYRVISSYDKNGSEISRRVRGRREAPADNIMRLDRKPEYDSTGMLVSETLRLGRSDRTLSGYTRKYQYDEAGNITGKLELDEQGKQVLRIEYVWQQNRDRLTREIHYDGNDRLERYLAKRYEVYQGSDRRHRVIDY
jgi:hypothetical protein